jgi:hypothetical protein
LDFFRDEKIEYRSRISGKTELLRMANYLTIGDVMRMGGYDLNTPIGDLLELVRGLGLDASSRREVHLPISGGTTNEIPEGVPEVLGSMLNGVDFIRFKQILRTFCEKHVGKRPGLNSVLQVADPFREPSSKSLLMACRNAGVTKRELYKLMCDTGLVLWANHYLS